MFEIQDKIEQYMSGYGMAYFILCQGQQIRNLLPVNKNVYVT